MSQQTMWRRSWRRGAVRRLENEGHLLGSGGGLAGASPSGRLVLPPFAVPAQARQADIVTVKGRFCVQSLSRGAFQLFG